jgi:hypothetical protein
MIDCMAFLALELMLITLFFYKKKMGILFAIFYDKNKERSEKLYMYFFYVLSNWQLKTFSKPILRICK